MSPTPPPTLSTACSAVASGTSPLVVTSTCISVLLVQLALRARSPRERTGCCAGGIRAYYGEVGGPLRIRSHHGLRTGELPDASPRRSAYARAKQLEETAMGSEDAAMSSSEAGGETGLAEGPAARLSAYLSEHGVEHEIIEHAKTVTALSEAHESKVPAANMA